MDAFSEMWHRLAAELGQEPSGAARRARVEAAARMAGVSLDTAYRRLKAAGWESGRATRKDRGTSALTAEAMEVITTRMARSRGRRGQTTLPLTEAVRVAHEEGATQLSHSQVARVMRAAGMGPAALQAPEAGISRVSTHPNHVLQIDVSIALSWTFRDPSGRRLDTIPDADTRFYKPEHFEGRRCWIHRWMATDHATGAFYVRYYYEPGERAETAVDFLWHVVSPKPEHIAHAFPLRGIPRRVVLDKGSAFRASLFRELLLGLGLDRDRVVFREQARDQIEHHEANNAKASGSVERHHLLWQAAFESRNRTAANLDELNERALRKCVELNCTREHTRHQMTRMEAWRTIRPHQLREAPDRATFFGLAVSAPYEGTLDNRCWLTVDKVRYLLTGGLAMPKARVRYRLAPFTDAGLRVWDEAGAELAVTRLCFDELGFPANGRRHVWDSEDAVGASAPRTPAQAIRRAVVRGERPSTDPAWIGAEPVVPDVVSLPIQGTPWVAPDRPAAAEPMLGWLDCAEEIARRLGGSMGDAADWWRARVGEGLTRSALEFAWAEFCAQPDLALETG